jgi:hypothetical protein
MHVELIRLRDLMFFLHKDIIDFLQCCVAVTEREWALDKGCLFCLFCEHRFLVCC